MDQKEKQCKLLFIYMIICNDFLQANDRINNILEKSAMDEIEVKTVNTDVHEIGKIVLAETSISRTVFYATLNNEGVHGKIVYEKKDSNGEWVYEKDLDKTKIKKGEWMSVDLKTNELQNIISYLQSLETFNEQSNLLAFNHYVFVHSTRGFTGEELQNINELFETSGTTLLKNLIKLKNEGKLPLIEKLSSNDGIEEKDVSFLLDNLDTEGIEATKLKINLKQLVSNIDELKQLIETESSEEEYQKFFSTHKELITLAFPSIIHVLGGKPFCGGKDFFGKGGAFGDFLCEESNNTVFVEIKKPNCKLVLDNEYRNGINKISNEIVNAVVQVKYQKDQFYKEYARDSSIRDNFYDCQCFIIAGKSMDLDSVEKRTTFEIFKKTQHNVTIITYDELLETLERLKRIMVD